MHQLTIAGKTCPYGVPGDRLWVRERWRVVKGVYVPGVEFADGVQVYPEWDDLGGIPDDWQTRTAWRPSIFMPRWASRITLEVVSVRVERVQDIRGDDCEAEGILYDPDEPEIGPCGADHDLNLMEKFAALWDSINAKRGYGWNTNPWVWVIEFKRVEGEQVSESEIQRERERT